MFMSVRLTGKAPLASRALKWLLPLKKRNPEEIQLVGMNRFDALK